LYHIEARIIEGTHTIGFRLSDDNGKLYDYSTDRVLRLATSEHIDNAVSQSGKLVGNNFNLNTLKKINAAELIKEAKIQAITTIAWKNRMITVDLFDAKKAIEYIKRISEAEEAYSEVEAFYMPDDLRTHSGHLSSGALPKWDFGEIFVKATGTDKRGNDNYSAVNESYIYRTFNGTGINIANAFPVVAVFKEDNGQTRAATASISMKFSGNLEYYRDIRNRLQDDNSIFANSQLYNFISEYPLCADDFVKMCLLDIMTYQEDRHVKNFGVIGNVLAPLYDNGASLGYDGEYIGDPYDAVFKAFGKKYVNIVQEVDEIRQCDIEISGDILGKGILSSKKYFKNIIDNKKLRQIEKYIMNSISVVNQLKGVRIC
jgi:hypothetical protein